MTFERNIIYIYMHELLGFPWWEWHKHLWIATCLKRSSSSAVDRTMEFPATIVIPSHSNIWWFSSVNRVRSQSTRSNPHFCCFNPHVWCFHISHGQISVSQTYISQKIGVETSIFHGQIPRGSGFQGEIPLYATRLGLPGRTHWLRRRRDGWHGQTPALGSSVPGPARSIRSSTGDFTIKTWHLGHQWVIKMPNYKWENAYLNAYSYIIRWFINGKII